VPGIGLFGNGTYGQPGQEDASPVFSHRRATGTNSPSYTVSGATLTVSPTIPTSFSWGMDDGSFHLGTGATPPTYYLSGSSGATESVIVAIPT